MKKLLLIPLVLLACTASAQFIEAGYEFSEGQSGPFFYAEHDFFLTEIPSLDMQIYASPSVEISTANASWGQLQIIADAPAFTVSARAYYIQGGSVKAKIAPLIPFGPLLDSDDPYSQAGLLEPGYELAPRGSNFYVNASYTVPLPELPVLGRAHFVASGEYKFSGSYYVQGELRVSLSESLGLRLMGHYNGDSWKFRTGGQVTF